MKKYALIILLLLHLISLLNGCCRVMQHEEVATENTDITAPAATEHNDTTVPLVDEEKKFNGKYYLIDTSFGNLISVEVPYFDGDSAINTAISEYIKEYLFTLTDVQYNFNECAEDIGMENAYNNYFIDIDYQIKYGSEDILSIVFSGICNKLEAAHPIHLFFTFNYDRVTERRLVATDVFTIDENMYDVFLRYFQIKMREIADEQWLSSVNIEDLFSKESFMVGMENESNWYLYYGTTSLGISCPVPHVMGDHIEIEIPYSELNSVLSKMNS